MEILEDALASQQAKVALTSNILLSFSTVMYRSFCCQNAKQTAASPQVAIH